MQKGTSQIKRGSSWHKKHMARMIKREKIRKEHLVSNSIWTQKPPIIKQPIIKKSWWVKIKEFLFK